IFTTDLAPGVLGWLGLNTASRHQPAGLVEVNPVVGVRHQAVERIVAELSGQKPHQYQPPTVSSPLGYLMPDSRYTAWQLGDGRTAEVVDLAQAVERHGLPFMRGLVDLDAVRAALERGRGLNQEYRLPVILALLGRHEEARDRLATDVEKLGDRQDAAAAYLRAFAEAFAAHTW